MTTAEGLGPRLRAERERQGLGVQKAAEELRLDAWIIEALEADDFSRVGAPVYAKGHLRKYAALLGLREQDLAGAIGSLNAADAASAPPLTEPSVRMSAGPHFAARLPWRQAATVAAFAALIAGVLWWKPWRFHPAKPEPGAAAVHRGAGAHAALAPAPPERAVPVPLVAARRAEPAAPGRTLPVSAAPVAVRRGPIRPGTLPLSFDVSDDSWIAVRDASGRILFRGIARAGQSVRLSGTAPFGVILGYAAGVRTSLGGRVVEIGPRFLSGRAARFDVDADGRPRRYGEPAPAGR